MDPSIPEMEQLRLRIEILEEEKKSVETINADLNLQLKYACFDAEASKRENMALRIKINELRGLLDDFKKK
jgi:uncharacterized protein (UPF0335 family)